MDWTDMVQDKDRWRVPSDVGLSGLAEDLSASAVLHAVGWPQTVTLLCSSGQIGRVVQPAGFRFCLFIFGAFTTESVKRSILTLCRLRV